MLANSGKLNFASGGVGGTVHMSGELFKMMSGIDMRHVPYRGEALALADLMGGQVQVIFATVTASIEYIKAGKLRALAVTTATPSEALPNVPTIGDFLPGYEASTWYGVGAPKSTPVEIINKLNMAINAALADPTFRTRVADVAAEPMPMTLTDFSKFIADDTDKWAKVVQVANIKAE